MTCLYCNSATNVKNSRYQKRTNTVWRRRHCTACKTVFSTVEAADTSLSIVVARQASLEPFLRDKLFLSVYDSLKHRKSALTDATSLTSTMLSAIYNLADVAQVERDIIVTIVTSVLERFDPVAAIHYKAYHPLDNRPS